MTRKEIRVGVVRCDRRALWYGAIFDKVDPNAYFEMDPASYHFMTWYHLELALERARGFRLTRVYDADRNVAARFAQAFGGRPMVCAELDEVSDDVDLVFIANESGDGRDHLKLARPGLLKGVPTFIDRPLAATARDAAALISLAKRRGAPLLSCSHMRFLPHAALFKARFAEIAPVERGVVHGHGPNVGEIADGLALATFLFGDAFGGRLETVQSMGSWPMELVQLRYVVPNLAQRRQVLVVSSHTPSPRRNFAAKALVSLGQHVDADELDAFVQPEGGLAVMGALREMVRTRCPPLGYAEMLEQTAILEAARKSHNGKRPLAPQCVQKEISR